MTKIKITGLKKEMSTTGTGASFTPGTGAQYASPKSFKKRDEIGEPFTTPNPSVPNRKSKFIDYKQLFEKAFKELYSPIKDMTSSQANVGDNSGYDMNSQDVASVLELAKFAKDGDFKIGDTATEKGTKYTVTDIDPVTGQISWDVDYVPAWDSVFKEFDELRKAISVLDKKTDDEVVDDIAANIRSEFNRYRTHIRKNYPEAYKKFIKEDINEEKGVSRNILLRLINNLGPNKFAEVIADLRDENLQDQIVAAFNMYSKDGTDYIKPDVLNEARYSQFKTETKLRTPTEQIHRAVREIRKKIDEIVKVVGHTERMKSELKQSNEGMSYLKRTRNAINTISEKLQDLGNRIKGLTE